MDDPESRCQEHVAFSEESYGIERSQPKIKVLCAVSDGAGEGRQTKTIRAPVIPPSQRPEERYEISRLDIISFWSSNLTLMPGFSIDSWESEQWLSYLTASILLTDPTPQI